MNEYNEKEREPVQIMDSDRAALEELREPILKMMEGELAEKLKNGHYKMIIGDDASGRVPALIVYGIAARFAQDREEDKPMMIFLAGSRKHADKKEKSKRTTEELRRILRRKNIDPDEVKNALVVTEHQHTGISSKPIVFGLQGLGIDVEIAAVSRKADNQAEGTLGVKKIYSGIDDPDIGVYQNEEVAGVIKYPEDMYSRRRLMRRGRYIGLVRQVADDIAEEIYQEIK
jgi:hypothetical protein